MRKGVAFVAFTEKGLCLAEKLAVQMNGTVRDGRTMDFSLRSWTAEQFPEREALIFIGAAGIAVRAVAPLLKDKTEDPAVLSMDEQASYVIPLVSGHLGGANRLAQRLAKLSGATAVLSTATDLNGVFAVDLWAKTQGLYIAEPDRIKQVSAKLLRGEEIIINCPWPVAGELPKGVQLSEESGDVRVAIRPDDSEALHLIPKTLCLGIGCRRGIRAEQIEEIFSSFCRERQLLSGAFAGAASIDRKQNEEGILRFCDNRALPVHFYSAEKLSQAEGCFEASSFVEKTVGVDNVCERAAVVDSGGELLEHKYAENGVTLAAAVQPLKLDWSWK